MKDVIFVLFAAIGLLLVGAGSTKILANLQEQEIAKAQANTIEAKIGALFSGKSCCPDQSQTTCTVPTNALYCAIAGYVLQIIGCAFYASRRGRSALFGFLGLLSPIGYVFLALLNPAVPEDPSERQLPTGRP